MSGTGQGILGTWDITIDTPLGARVVSLEVVDENTGTAGAGFFGKFALSGRRTSTR